MVAGVRAITPSASAHTVYFLDNVDDVGMFDVEEDSGAGLSELAQLISDRIQMGGSVFVLGCHSGRVPSALQRQVDVTIELPPPNDDSRAALIAHLMARSSIDAVKSHSSLAACLLPATRGFTIKHIARVFRLSELLLRRLAVQAGTCPGSVLCMCVRVCFRERACVCGVFVSRYVCFALSVAVALLPIRTILTASPILSAQPIL